MSLADRRLGRCNSVSITAGDTPTAAAHCAQGMDPKEQKEIDMKMIDLDGTDNKGKLGARRRTARLLSPAHTQ